MTSDVPEIAERWRQAWPQALEQWGAGLRLQPPILLTRPPVEAGRRRRKPRAHDPIAWFDLRATTVTVNLARIASMGMLELPLPVLAHEIGHHVYAPADASTAARLIARCSKGLVDRPRLAPAVSNVWSDTLINDRLQRHNGLAMDTLYRAMPPPTAPMSVVWFRGLELLWSLPSQSLTRAVVDEEMDTDALLLSRHTRVFARDPVGGAAGFAALMRRWILDDPSALELPGALCAAGGAPTDALDGVAMDDSLDGPAVHPALDRRVNPEAGGAGQDGAATARDENVHGAGQGFGPARLAEVYDALGMTRDAAVDWYTARATPHLIAFPTTPTTSGVEEELQGWEPWQIGEDLAAVDWLATVTRSAHVVPGLTTVQRIVDHEPQTGKERLPLDLDLYVDSSGSMPNPRAELSPSVLAGVVIGLSALRAGARVQVTVWAGADQVARTPDGFTRDRRAVVQALVHYFGGGTSFPLNDLAQDHPPRTQPLPPWQPATHICVISDSGVVSMFGKGQRAAREHIAGTALTNAGGGGSLILCEDEAVCETIRAGADGYAVYAVPQEADLVAFAAEFAARTWGVR